LLWSFNYRMGQETCQRIGALELVEGTAYSSSD